MYQPVRCMQVLLPAQVHAERDPVGEGAAGRGAGGGGLTRRHGRNQVSVDQSISCSILHTHVYSILRRLLLALIRSTGACLPKKECLICDGDEGGKLRHVIAVESGASDGGGDWRAVL